MAMTREQINQNRSNVFGCILYPDFDENHRKFIKYIKNHDYQYQYAMIRHDRDYWTDDDEEVKNGNHYAGEPKKAHTHFIFKQKERQTVESIKKYFAGWVNHFEKVNSVRGQLNYFIHDTPESSEKAQYSPADIEGSPKLLAEAFDKTQILYNLGQIAEYCKRGYKISEIITEILNITDSSEQQMLFETFSKWQHVVVAMSNQEINDKIRRKKYESSID